jgi:hemoglobin
MSQHGVDEPAQQSDYDAIGGGAAVSAVVDRFYQRVTGDPRLAPFFDGVDLPALKRHQVFLVSQVMGGPVEYSGRELGEAHARLHIGDEEFSAVVEHLVAALREFDVPPDIIDRVVTALSATRPDIVTAD